MFSDLSIFLRPEVSFLNVGVLKLAANHVAASGFLWSQDL